METAFENKTVLTKEVLYEYIKSITKKKTQTIAAVAGILFILLAVVEYRHGKVSSSVWSLLLSIVIFVCPEFCFRFLANRSYQQQLTLNGGKELQKTTKFTENGIQVVTSNKAEASFQYGQITHIIETKNLIILKVDRQVFILLAKNNYSAGDLSSFLCFLRKECVSASLLKR
jgi:multisubunit Na+/H+ antiporter MnhG subunit